MSEERAVYEVLNPPQDCDIVNIQAQGGFVDVRTREGKLIFRLDPLRRLVEWREGKHVELVDLSPLLP